MTSELMKVFFTLDSDAWHGGGSESMWARPLAGTPQTLLLELQNSPFYAYGVSFLDVVRVVEKDGVCEYAGTAREGGHSTYRLIVEPAAPFDEWWVKVAEFGCTYEGGTHGANRLLAVDVPPTADLHAVFTILQAGETAGVWMFEQAHAAAAALAKRPAAPSA